MNYVAAILLRAKSQRDVAAIEDAEKTITFGELPDLVARTAGYLADIGIRPGDRVGLALKGGWCYAILTLGVGYLGAVMAPIDWRSRPAEKSRTASVLGLKAAFVDDDADDVDSCTTVRVGSQFAAELGRARPATASFGNWDAPFLISATSGTTGLPQFTETTHLQSHLRGLTDGLETPAGKQRRILCTFPLSFTAGRSVLLQGLYRGGTIIIGPTLFGPDELIECVDRAQANVVYGVPMVARNLLKIAKGRLLLPALDALAIGGAGLSDTERRMVVDTVTPNYFENYSSSATGMIATLGPRDIAEHPDTVGQIVPMVELEIVDPDNQPVASGNVGQIRVRTPKLGRPLQIAGQAPRHDFRDGWHYPGDLGSLDDRGYLRISGRESDVIVRRGAKIQPAEIESVLLAIDGVSEAAVVGVPGQDRDESIVAFIVTRGPVTTGDLLAQCRARLAPYKIPQAFHFVPALPRNSAGKIDKRQIKTNMSNSGAT